MPNPFPGISGWECERWGGQEKNPRPGLTPPGIAEGKGGVRGGSLPSHGSHAPLPSQIQALLRGSLCHTNGMPY